MNELGISEIVISFAAVLLAVVVFFARKLMNAFADDFSAKALERVNNELRADIVDVLGGMMVELGDSNSAVNAAADALAKRYPGIPIDTIRPQLMAVLPDVITWAQQARSIVSPEDAPITLSDKRTLRDGLQGTTEKAPKRGRGPRVGRWD